MRFHGPRQRGANVDFVSLRAANDERSLLVRFSDDLLPVLPLIPVEKVKAAAIRVVTWNTLDAGLLDWSRQDRFHRVLLALEPDILVLQEMGGNSREATRDLIASWLTYAPIWNVVANGDSRDSVILSRYPILDWRNVFGTGTFSSTAALVDTREAVGRETLIVAAHLTCCDADAARDMQVGLIASLIQDARTPGGSFTVPRRTPMVLLGDLNLVGKAEQLTTLLEGRLVQGAHQPPDWDGTPFAQLAARHNAVPDTYTWRATLPGIRFPPGFRIRVQQSSSVVSVYPTQLRDWAQRHHAWAYSRRRGRSSLLTLTGSF